MGVFSGCSGCQGINGNARTCSNVPLQLIVDPQPHAAGDHTLSGQGCGRPFAWSARSEKASNRKGLAIGILSIFRVDQVMSCCFCLLLFLPNVDNGWDEYRRSTPVKCEKEGGNGSKGRSECFQLACSRRKARKDRACRQHRRWTDADWQAWPSVIYKSYLGNFFVYMISPACTASIATGTVIVLNMRNWSIPK